MTEPLVPPDVDLTDFRFMPFEFGRLFQSETWVLANDAEKVAAITLWGKSWTEVPAGSLPNDDRMLAHLSGTGSRWKKIKPMALRGWVLANDGRLYHPVVCEKALESWIEKLTQRVSSGAGNASRWGAEFDPAPLVEQIHVARRMLAALDPDSRMLKKKVPNGVPPGKKKSPTGNPDGNPTGNPVGIPIHSQETGTGTRTDLSPEGSTHAEGSRTARVRPQPPPPDPSRATTEAGRACLLMRRAGCATTNPSHPDLLAAIAEGVTPEALAHTVTEALTKTPPIARPFAWAISTARSRHAAGAASPTNGEPHAADYRGAAPRRESLSERSARINAEHDAREGDPGF